MFQRSPRGRELFLVDNQVRVFDQLLYSPPKYGPSRYFGGHFLQAAKNDVVVRGTNGQVVRVAPEKTPDGKPVAIWQSQALADPQAIAICRDTVIIAGRKKAQEGAAEAEEFAVLALRLDDGQQIWEQSLPAAPVSWGLAVDLAGRAVITLADGRVLWFGSDK